MMTFGVVVDLLDRDFTRSGLVTSAAVVATPGTVGCLLSVSCYILCVSLLVCCVDYKPEFLILDVINLKIVLNYSAEYEVLGMQDLNSGICPCLSDIR